VKLAIAIALAACGHAPAPGDVAELRARCARFALVHADKSVENIGRGARITYRADDVGALQSELRMQAEHLAAGSCKMAM